MPTPPTLTDHELQIELQVAEADLEHKLAQLREVVTERVDRTIERVRRPLRWLDRYKWFLAVGTALAVTAFVAIRHRMR